MPQALSFWQKLRLGFLAFTIVIVCATLVWIRTVTVETTYAFVQQEKELHHLKQEIQSLRIEWLKLTAPDRLEALAENRKLVRPTSKQIFRYDAGVKP